MNVEKVIVESPAVQAPVSKADPAGRAIEATDGWSALEFYAFIIRSLGIPASFRLGEKGWVADGPFTPPSKATLANLEAHGV